MVFRRIRHIPHSLFPGRNVQHFIFLCGRMVRHQGKNVQHFL
ncbi:hypothetical protein B4135_1391 [Caldibacillus debilis]|uniref:Uncharacterized protein n=1 Tax=Caldibacillus debilis TaxID=301148 RepID=A0A150MCV0_9BACI|nr:hypothetical protein B4135_1391 [Caldibacillus debilis]